MLLFLALVTLPIPSGACQFTVTTVYDGGTVKARGHDIIIYVLLAGIVMNLTLGFTSSRGNKPFME